MTKVSVSLCCLVFLFATLPVSAGDEEVERLAHDLQNGIVVAQKKLVQQLKSKSSTKMTKMNEAEVVAIAERFVSQQGYTDKPADKSQLVRESLERSSDVEKILASRHDTLLPKAFGIVPAGKSSAWLVIFQFKNHTPERNTGRAVSVVENGKTVRIIHQDILLKAATKTF